MEDWYKCFRKKLQKLIYPNLTPTSHFLINIIFFCCHLVSLLFYFFFTNNLKKFVCIFLFHVFYVNFMTIFSFSTFELVLRYSNKSLVIITLHLVFKMKLQRRNILDKMQKVLIFSLGLTRRGFKIISPIKFNENELYFMSLISWNKLYSESSLWYMAVDALTFPKISFSYVSYIP